MEQRLRSEKVVETFYATGLKPLPTTVDPELQPFVEAAHAECKAKSIFDNIKDYAKSTLGIILIILLVIVVIGIVLCAIWLYCCCCR